MQIDIIIYAGVAAVLIVWLSKVIGTKHGQERERQNPFTKGGAYDPAVLAAKKAEKQVSAPETRATSVTDTIPRGVEVALVQIAITDPDFDSRRFVEQAKDAFLFVVEAFARGDRDTLRDLLSPEIYPHFDAELTARKAANETLTTEVQAFKAADIVDASLVGTLASVTVKFRVSEIYAVRASDGSVRQGNPDKPIELVDVWTFGRDIGKADPRWFVTATRPDTSAAPERAG